LQNGLPFWYVREPPLRSVDPTGTIGRMFPDERIVGGVVHVSGTMVAPGRIRQSGGLRYVFGDPSGGASERSDAIVKLFATAGLAPEADPAIRRTIWLKLVNNVGLNATSVLERLTIKQMLESPEVRAQVRGLMVETLEVGRAMGVIDDVDVDARIEYAARLSDVKTSMLQDYERGRSLEIDPILGAVCELGERFRVTTPAVRRAYDALR
jgi:2-dehydropantoate 2-reductase